MKWSVFSCKQNTYTFYFNDRDHVFLEMNVVEKYNMSFKRNCRPDIIQLADIKANI